MDFILNRLTDMGLRRLYKFVLKRTIGKYLEDDLLIEQLEVISRDGVVKLKDIRFSADVLNEEFLAALPVKIVSFTVSVLEVHLSYNTILTDSCRFVIEDVDIVIAPNELYSKLQSSAKKPKDRSEASEQVPSPQAEPPRAQPEHTSEEGQRSLSFIANWIEIIVARLQVQVGTVNVTFRIPSVDASSEAGRHHKSPEQFSGLNSSSLNRSRAAAPVTHDLTLTLRNIQYFNDDPQSYSKADANSVALSTKLTTAPDYSTSATAIQLGSRKVVRLESIEVRLVPCRAATTMATSAAPTAVAATLIRLGNHLVMNVKLDRSQHSGALKGIDVDTTVPNFLISIDIHSAKSLCLIISAYLATVASEVAPKSSNTTPQRDKDAPLSKSIMQNVLMSDPTLRTLFWLEEQENQKKRAGKSGGVAAVEVLKKGDGGTGDVNDIDFARIAQLMRQYRTTRNAISAPTDSATSSKPNLASSALLSQSALVDSDSDGDFPASAPGSSSDANDDDSDDDSAYFHDAVSKKPVLRVRMGESKRGGGGVMQSAMSGLNKSSYGGASNRGIESGLYHSTTSGLLGSNYSTGSASGMEQSGTYGSAVYTAAPVPLVLSARLHILTADLLFTDVRNPAPSSVNLQHFASQPSREELCLHMEEAVMRVSTVLIPSPPATAFPYRKLAPNNSRNSVTCSVSVAEVQLYEQYGEINYRSMRDRHLREEFPATVLPRQKQLIVSFHSLQDSRRIYSSPHLNVSVEYTPPAEKSPQTSPTDRNNCACIVTTVNLEPVVVSAGIATIEHWVAALSGFPLIGVAEEASSTAVTCTVNIAQIELFLHADNREENYAAISSRVAPERSVASAQDAYSGYWDTVLDAVDLTQHPDAWTSLHNSSSSSPYHDHLFASRGGFRFLLAEISIKLATAERKRSLNDSVNLSDSKKLGRSASGESMLQAVEMSQVCLFVYISLPSVPTARFDAELVHEDRRRFYSTLLVKASSNEKRLHKVVISRVDPNLSAKLNRSASEDAHDDDFVLLKDLHRQSAGDGRGSAVPPPAASSMQATGDVGPSAPTVSSANLIYVSAYHIQVDIKQREYNVLMMVSDTIAPKPAESLPTSHTAPSVPVPPSTQPVEPRSPASPTSLTGKSTGFGFVLSSKLATICLSDNEPHVFDFPELDELLVENNSDGTGSGTRRSERRKAKTATDKDKGKSFSICVSIIEPAFEVLISNKDIYLSVKADDLSIYEMELAQFRQLLQSGFDFNQTTGREARYGPNRHLVPFIRRASLHSHANSTANALSLGVNKTDLFSTLLGNNQDYGQAFEVRLLLTSSGTGKASSSGPPAAEVKSVHFFIDFYDIMLSYDPQSTWILSVANMLTPQTAAQILCHRQEERLRAAVERYQRLSPRQRDQLGLSMDEFVRNMTADSEPCCVADASTASNIKLNSTTPKTKTNVGSASGVGNNGKKTGNGEASANKNTITLALPFELTKVNVRVRDCIIDFCCDPCSSRTFLTIGLLTVTSTIASNSQRFSLKFKVGGLSLYISDVLPLPTVQTLRKAGETAEHAGHVAFSNLADSVSGLRASRFKKFPSLFDSSRLSSEAALSPEELHGSEIYDEDIGQFLVANSFVDLASVDHIDVLVTINNSELEALAIQINIGLCSINACVDSLELFAKTMGEWFREFQVACAKSEDVMQKKSAAKSMRDLNNSHYAFRAPSGNILDDDNFDTIRFCDPLPVHGPHVEISSQGEITAESVAVKGPTGTGHTAQALPADMLENVSLATLMGQPLEPGMHRTPQPTNSRGIFVQSSSTAASDMNSLIVEDYYAGLSLPTPDPPTSNATIPGTNLKTAANSKVGVFSPFPASPFPTVEYPDSATPRSTYTESTAHSSSNLQQKWVAQYDYEDHDGSDRVISERGVYANPPPSAPVQSVGARAPLTLEPPRTAIQDVEEEEGGGGFYGPGHDADDLDGGDLDELEYASDEDIDHDHGDEGDGNQQPEYASDQDESSVPSVKSIDLDDTFEQDQLKDSATSQASSQDSGQDTQEAEKPMARSVFGLGNFPYFGLNTAPATKPVYEEFELKDFNPQPVLESVDVAHSGDMLGNLPFAAEPSAANPILQYHSTAQEQGQEDGSQAAWLQEELSASVDQDGKPRRGLTVSISSHRSNEDFAHNSDPEDDPLDHHAPYEAGFAAETLSYPADVGTEAQYEADFGQEHVSYEADYGYGDFDEPDTAHVIERSSAVQTASQMSHSRNSDDLKNATSKEGEGWQRFHENMQELSLNNTPSTSAKTVATAAHITTPIKDLVSDFTTSPPVQVANLSTAEQIALEDHDRAWSQQPYDHVYESYHPIDKDESGTKQAASSAQAMMLPIPVEAAAAAPSSTGRFTGSVKPSNTVEGAKKAGNIPVQAAQWYQNPDQLEIMPHYIPVVSRTEDLDDNRPAEEKSMHSKMLMKLKGTFKIRLFQGSDWHRAPSSITAIDYSAERDGGASSVVAPREEGSAGTTTGKSVRFKKEDLLRDLTAPASSTPAGLHADSRTSKASGIGKHSGVGGSRGAPVPAGAMKGTSSRPARSSKPLFEDTATVGAGKRDATVTKESTNPTDTTEPAVPRNQRDMLDATFKELFFCIRLYDNSSAGSVPPVYSLPAQRMVCSAHDFLVSFGRVGARRKKVLGSWISLNRPRDVLEPVLRCAFLAYENPPITNAGAEDAASATAAAPIVMEHRLYVRILPLRCYLDEGVISFAKQLAANAANNSKAAAGSASGEETIPATEGTAPLNIQPKEDLFFQSIMITATEIKIDYRASSVNIQALNAGDYLQLLNIFPLDGLEITLKHVKINGVKGVPAFVSRMLEQWIKDIYSNQLHRVISGTAPFRGLSNIGNDLHELMAIPLRDYRKTGGTLKQLRRSTRTLVRTVTRETLHATQQLTMFVANAISELASDGPPAIAGNDSTAAPASTQARITTHGQSSTSRRPGGGSTATGGAQRQPSGVVEGLEQAMHSVTREVSSAAETVIAIPIREYVHTGPGGYLKSVIRAFPIAVLRPVAGVIEGVSYTMLGLRNDIDPTARLDEEDVWNVDIGTAFPASPVPGAARPQGLPHPTTSTAATAAGTRHSGPAGPHTHKHQLRSGEKSGDTRRR